MTEAEIIKSQIDKSQIANPNDLEVAPGTAHENLEGWIPEIATDQEVREALEKAFDYRGDVLITCKDGSKVQGYIFDRRDGQTLADSYVRLFTKDSSETLNVFICQIAALVFPGRDHTAGQRLDACVGP